MSKCDFTVTRTYSTVGYAARLDFIGMYVWEGNRATGNSGAAKCESIVLDHAIALRPTVPITSPTPSSRTGPLEDGWISHDAGDGGGLDRLAEEDRGRGEPPGRGLRADPSPVPRRAGGGNTRTLYEALLGRLTRRSARHSMRQRKGALGVERPCPTGESPARAMGCERLPGRPERTPPGGVRLPGSPSGAGCKPTTDGGAGEMSTLYRLR